MHIIILNIGTYQNKSTIAMSGFKVPIYEINFVDALLKWKIY